MVISSVGGLMLDHAVARFDGIAVFQPVMNGVGGNLVAVQASRISTHLHSRAPSLGALPDSESKVCLSPWAVFFGSSTHARTAKILFMMVIPGHLLFTYAIVFLEAGHTSPTFVFIASYLAAALIQVKTEIKIFFRFFVSAFFKGRNCMSVSRANMESTLNWLSSGDMH